MQIRRERKILQSERGAAVLEEKEPLRAQLWLRKFDVFGLRILVDWGI
jgi:hypothetical protein